jgi:ABC-type multidrug transport system ATPase subunit
MRPVLEALRLRVDVDGVPQVDGLSFTTTGDRVVILAGPPALFQAAAAMTRPRHGELRCAGVTPAEAIEQRLMAGAPLDPPMPPSWTPSDYVTWSARLSGQPTGAAERLAREALAKLKLESLRSVRLRHVPLPARRAVSVAAALATGATTLLLEDPVCGLTEDAARSLARLVVRGTEGVRTVLFAARASLTSPLAMDADEALVLDGSRLLSQGAPGEVALQDRSYALRLHRGGPAFGELAERRGVHVTGHGASWVVDLGATLQLSDVLDVAAAANAIVIDLRPLGRAFA